MTNNTAACRWNSVERFVADWLLLSTAPGREARGPVDDGRAAEHARRRSLASASILTGDDDERLLDATDQPPR